MESNYCLKCESLQLCKQIVLKDKRTIIFCLNCNNEVDPKATHEFIWGFKSYVVGTTLKDLVTKKAHIWTGHELLKPRFDYNNNKHELLSVNYYKATQVERGVEGNKYVFKNKYALFCGNCKKGTSTLKVTIIQNNIGEVYICGVCKKQIVDHENYQFCIKGKWYEIPVTFAEFMHSPRPIKVETSFYTSNLFLMSIVEAKLA